MHSVEISPSSVWCNFVFFLPDKVKIPSETAAAKVAARIVQGDGRSLVDSPLLIFPFYNRYSPIGYRLNLELLFTSTDQVCSQLH